MGETKKNFRVLTLLSSVALILTGIVLVVVAFALAYLVWAVGSDGDAAQSFVWFFAGGWLISVMVFCAVLTVAIMTIVIGAREIKLIAMDNFNYSKRVGTIIGHLIYDAIMAIVFGTMIVVNYEAVTDVTFVLFVLSVAITCVFVLSFIFVLTDRIIFVRRLKTGKISDQEVTSQQTNVNFSAVNPQAKQEPVKSDVENLEDKLTSLKNLKDKGLLTDEEYDLAKKNAIEKHMK